MNNSLGQASPELPQSCEKTPNRRERRCAETRERIIRAALRLFSERGVVATTIEDITNAADVGKGTFFNYFPSKEHILAHLCQLQMGKIREFVSQAIHSTEIDGSGAIRACFDSYRRICSMPGAGAEHSRARCFRVNLRVSRWRMILKKIGRCSQS